MTNPLEQLKGIELKANFTPTERRYFYKLRDELEVIVGGVSIEELNKPTDVVQAKRIRAKLEEILKFVQDREIEKIEVVDKKSFMEWVQLFGLQEKLTEDWINRNIKFNDDTIVCKEKLDLTGSDIVYLPNQLIAEHDLCLADCVFLTYLPDSLRNVSGDLDLGHCTSLMSLPQNLTEVNGDLNLRNCTSLMFLPRGLTKIRGHLNLSKCTSLINLPDNLTVHGYVALEGCTSLTHLPDNLRVTYSSLNLTGCTSLTHLSDSLNVVNGYISLNGCIALAYLPENLKVAGDLSLVGCVTLATLPDKLTVSHNLYLKGCSLEIIKKAYELKACGQIEGDIKEQ
jgi:hypothetical protein